MSPSEHQQLVQFLERRFEAVDRGLEAMTQSLRRLETLLSSEQGRREALERDLATLRENISLLEARIVEFQRRLGS